jgi:outer membrane protein TolC
MKINVHKFSKFNRLKGSFPFFMLFLATLVLHTGCSTPAQYRKGIDKVAADIISEKQIEATGKATEFNVEKPGDTLRRRLLSGQNLPISGPPSLGTDKLKPPEHWPENSHPKATYGSSVIEPGDVVNEPLTLSLVQALQIGARNSFEYQNQKEQVFKTALGLELERDAFRNIFVGQIESLLSTDSIGDRTVSGTVTSGDSGISRKLKSGARLSTALAIDLANLLTMGGASSLGIAGDATVSIPLLRGAGKHIVTEPLTQAERNAVYAIWDFERFKKKFAVNTASKYLSVLQQLDAVKNSDADYRSRIASARRSRRLADAGRIKKIEVDQAVQNELRARQGWIAARQRYKKQLDSFKSFLGLPLDSFVELDPNELELLISPTKAILEQIAEEDRVRDNISIPAADAVIKLKEPDNEKAGPLELNETLAISLAFDNRFDLRLTDGKVYDAQRAVVVAADALGAELTFLGSAKSGERRTVTTADLDSAQLRTDKGVYSAILTLDLPFERTGESIDYRISFINLERAVRDVQILEDEIKTEIRNALRDMLEARENMYIQAKAVYVAQKRVKSVNMFLEAGRAQTRDLLEAQDDLLSAQNLLTASVVDYRIAELEIQRDMGVLEVNEKGLWHEYESKEK